MEIDALKTEKRKKDHLQFFRDGSVASKGKTTWLEYVHFVHQALPEVDFNSVDISSKFAGLRFDAPFFITGMTGGTAEAAEINGSIASIAEKYGLGFGLGSMRAMMEKPDLIPTYLVRDRAPSVFLAGNLGGTQVAHYPAEKIVTALERIGADALCVHLNPAQELMQPEGDRDFRQVLDAIRNLVSAMDVPVIVKETGAGLSRETVLKLAEAGVRHVDISGAGGTSWVGVEVLRQGRAEDEEALAYWDWGLPTAAALAEVAGCGMEIIASGGIRTGLDAGRVLALGARMAGIAAPMLQSYFKGGETECDNAICRMVSGLKTVVALTGCRNLEELGRAPRVITGPLRDWMVQRSPELLKS